MAKINQAGFRRRIRGVIPDWLQRRLVPFECEVERLAAEFCMRHSGARVLDLAGASAAYAPDSIGLDRNVWTLRERRGSRICADAHHLPLRPGVIDALCCSASLHHFEDPSRCLFEMRECLKPGGELFLSVPYRFPQTGLPDDYYRFDRGNIVRLLEETQWCVDLCEPIGGRYWVASRTLLERLFGWCGGFRTPLFVLSAPLLGFLAPLCCFYLDRIDRCKDRTLGWSVIARKEAQ